MDRAEIEKLAALARIDVAEDEYESYAREINDVLAYIKQVQTETEGGAHEMPEPGAVRTVMREDGEPHAPGTHTETLLAAAPRRTGNYIRVKQILTGKHRGNHT